MAEAVHDYLALGRALFADPGQAGVRLRHKVVCPVCGYDYARFTGVRLVSSNNRYEAGWGGRGDLLVVQFEGECRHEWEICFGFHKGQTFAFARRLIEGR